MKFGTIKHNSAWAIVIPDEPEANGYSLKFIRQGLTMRQAEVLASRLTELANCKMTRNCNYCGGVGGCYYCDS
jgi:hypothetical protein